MMSDTGIGCTDAESVGASACCVGVCLGGGTPRYLFASLPYGLTGDGGAATTGVPAMLIVLLEPLLPFSGLEPSPGVVAGGRPYSCPGRGGVHMSGETMRVHIGVERVRIVIHAERVLLCTLSSTGTPNDRLRALRAHLSGLQGTARIVSVIDVVQPCFLHFTCTRTDRVQNIYRAKNRLSQCTRRGVVQSSAQVDERASVGTCACSLRDMRRGEGWCSRGIAGGEFGGALGNRHSHSVHVCSRSRFGIELELECKCERAKCTQM